MKVIVVGGGRVGYYLAKTLLEHSHQPIVIELDKTICSFIANSLDIPVICGDGTTLEILDNADINSCDAIICVTGKDENNLIACQLAKKLYNIPKTIAKVNNPKNYDALKQLGVDIVVSGTDNIARLLEHEIDASTIRRLLSLDGGRVSISEILLPDEYELHGKKISELKLPPNCNIVSVSRDGELIIPYGSLPLKSADRIMMLCEESAFHELSLALKLQL